METTYSSEKTTDKLKSQAIVSSYNEWDPLEEIIVGRIDGAVIAPIQDKAIAAIVKPKTDDAKDFFSRPGEYYPQHIQQKAQTELNELIGILKAEGIIVRQPEPFDFNLTYKTPYWSSTGFTTSCPRDAFLVIGNEIIEAPMSWRCRYFESLPYKKLFNEYFENGAKWTAAPKPALSDDLYTEDASSKLNNEVVCITNESEIVFDAADFVKFGKDIIVARSHTTNLKGIAWLERHLGSNYTIHCIENVRAKCPMHLDTTLIPIAPGRLIINPKYFDTSNLPSIFRSWEIFTAPEPECFEGINTTYFGSLWLSLNMLCIAPNKVIVEARQKRLIKQLNDWGVETIPCPFAHYEPYEGAFHCATLDIRRRGALQSYF